LVGNDVDRVVNGRKKDWEPVLTEQMRQRRYKVERWIKGRSIICKSLN